MTEHNQNDVLHDQSSEVVDSDNQESRLMAMLIYLLSLFSGFIGPLIIWIIKHKESRFVNKAGKNYLNFVISYTIWTIIILVVMLVPFFIGLSMSTDTSMTVGFIIYIIGFIIMMVLAFVSFIFTIIACVKYYNGNEYLIPLSIRFFK
ncbi:DUF4870 domain-containing protein [Staphylococcus warneri]|uniref:DUF4870 domain-containing protein n=1 Tax=Staphylococcus warneri TaxID=1292 RepID=UPI0022E4F5FB|nr:DUF4870 domain-containing protein [Staphylococcus warneri]